MKKVLVTGGGGFIGEKVVQELLRRNCHVRVFDIVPSNIKGVDCGYNGSILDPYELARAVKGCDYVIHLAAALGVERTETNRLECLFINIQGIVNVLEACVRERIKKIVFSSSSEVYGEQRIQPITEDAPLNPKSNYAISKIVGEEYLRAYSETYGIKYNIVRLFNVYGEKQRKEFVIPKFIMNIVAGTPPTIYGKGDQARSFCYVEDAARGIVDTLFSRVDGEVFNIGNDQEPVELKALANRAIKISKAAMKPKFVSYKSSDRNSDRDIIKRMPSIKKARKVLGYKPRISLDEGLKKIIYFYQDEPIGK